MSGDPLRFHGDQLTRTGALDFAVNIWPTPQPPSLRDALAAALTGSQPYPDPAPATAAIAHRHRRSAEEVLPLNGACEVFWLLARAVRTRHAVCVHPAFTEPDAALRAAGVTVDHILRRPDDDWALWPADVPETADLVVLGNPNNPTGTLDPAETVASLARPGRVLVVDESFIELSEQTCHSLAERRDIRGLVVVRSITKLWGLAGLRAGYCLAPPDLVQALRDQGQPWGVNTIALAALEHSAVDRTTAPRVAAEVAAARADLLRRLGDLPGLRAWPSAVNFLLLHAPGRGLQMTERLADAGITIRPAHTFPGLDHNYLRVAVRTPHAHARLADALATALRAMNDSPAR